MVGHVLFKQFTGIGIYANNTAWYYGSLDCIHTVCAYSLLKQTWSIALKQDLFVIHKHYRLLIQMFVFICDKVV